MKMAKNGKNVPKRKQIRMKKEKNENWAIYIPHDVH